MSRNGRRLACYLAAQRGEALRHIDLARDRDAGGRRAKRRIARNVGFLAIGSASL